MNLKMLKAALAGLILFISSVTHAGLIIGGSEIIDQNDLNILGGWLGNTNIDLTNIFTKSGSLTSKDWHEAVDGKGATFTLIEAISNGNSFTFGGYNHFSWSTSNKYTLTDATVDQSFLFSLTNNIKLERSRFSYSSYNHSNYGSTFGGGHDLYINSALSSGYSNLGHSYGDSTQYNQDSNRIILAGGFKNWEIQKYETFTISESAAQFAINSIGLSPQTVKVPEPTTFLLLFIGLIAIIHTKSRTI